MSRNYSNWLHAYLSHTRYSESPDSFHFWTGVGTIAGALRRRVWIDQRHFQWTPNFYIVLVGPPGVAAKSTSIRAGLSLLEEIPGIFFGPQSMTWQALAESLQGAQEHVDIPDRPERELMSCVTIGVSELGTFLRPDDPELIDMLIAMWDGQKEVWRRKTRTQGDTVINNPWLNVIGCTTPAWLKQNFPDVLIGGGLTSRIVFVYADQKRQLVAYPGDMVTSSEWENERKLLIDDLLQISELAGEVKLDVSAKAFGIAWYEQHWQSPRPPHMTSDRFAGYIARKQTHIHKLAMVLSAAKGRGRVILEEDLAEADLAITELERDMIKVFTSIGVTDDKSRASEEVVTLVKNSGEIEYQKLWKQCFALMPLKEFLDALKAGIEAGYLKILPREGKKYVKFLKEGEK